jgi:hypothetical protein
VEQATMSLADLVTAAADAADNVLQYKWRNVLPAGLPGQKRSRKDEREIDGDLFRLRCDLECALQEASAECPESGAEGARLETALSLVGEEGLGFIDALTAGRERIREQWESKAEVLGLCVEEVAKDLCAREHRLAESSRRLRALVPGLQKLAVENEKKPNAGEPASKGKRPARKRVTRDEANDEMMKAIEIDPERMKWSVREWATHVGCSTSTICHTQMWRQCKKAREKAKQERMQRNRGRRKPQHRSQA